MQTLLTYEQIREKLVARLANLEGLAAAYIFGSVREGNHTPDSDIDIGLLFENALPGMSILQLQEELTEYLGMQADVVQLNTAPPILRMQVLRKGEKILDLNVRVSSGFFARTLFEYDDLKRFLKPIEENILKGRIYG